MSEEKKGNAIMAALKVLGLDLVKSKRFRTMVISIVLVPLFIKYLKLDPETANTLAVAIFGVVAVYVGGQSLADGLSGGKTSANAPE